MTVGAAKFAKHIQKQVRARKTFPTGHMVGIAYAQMFGPKNATTPEGHPITICSGMFDNTLVTAVSAIARRASTMFGYVPNLADWDLEMEEDVSVPKGHAYDGKIPYSKMYHFAHLPERNTKWKDRGLTTANVQNWFHASWYITHRHAQPGYIVDQSLATVLIPAKEI